MAIASNLGNTSSPERNPWQTCAWKKFKPFYSNSNLLALFYFRLGSEERRTKILIVTARGLGRIRILSPSAPTKRNSRFNYIRNSAASSIHIFLAITILSITSYLSNRWSIFRAELYLLSSLAFHFSIFISTKPFTPNNFPSYVYLDTCCTCSCSINSSCQ
jgi:hypothetical protein